MDKKNPKKAKVTAASKLKDLKPRTDVNVKGGAQGIIKIVTQQDA